MAKRLIQPSENGEKQSIPRRLKNLVIGKAKDHTTKGVFHQLTLIAFFAWVGLGSDAISSSCYGPEEAFRALHGHTYLSIFVGLASVFTIFIISSSYNQIIELFPNGGGGYMVASRLISPSVGMVAGSALIIDYVLTITLSVASGADAIFSFLPPEFLIFKLYFAVAILVLLILLNLRGLKESIYVLLPVFIVFVVMHGAGLLISFFTHSGELSLVAKATATDLKDSVTQIGIWGVLALLIRAYSMGAGTYTGIEAVSNGVSILREPRVKTAKKVMLYMSISLSVLVLGFMVSYLLYGVHPEPGKTLNAVLFSKVFGSTGIGYILLLILLVSEAAILFVAAQTGFVGGPRMIATMAGDKWFPTRFMLLSDRLVTQNGILVMGIAAMIILVMTHGNVSFLIVLYSINVFITFVLSQLGMVKHWWLSRKTELKWKRKLTINAVGLVLSLLILVCVVVFKFYDGGWITIFITGALVALVLSIKTHYNKTAKLLKRLDELVMTVMPETTKDAMEKKLKEKGEIQYDPEGKTAVVLVNGFNGLGLHTLLNIFRLFHGVFKNFVILQVGVVDTGSFKSGEEIEKLNTKITEEVDRYVNYIKTQGYFADGFAITDVDVVEGVTNAAPEILKKYPNAIFFGGQLVFPEEIFLSRWLHNYTVFAIQRKFYYQGIPMVMI
ncbi:MAG: APC family permease, partial [Candidatus Firestonebacteria bacterium]